MLPPKSPGFGFILIFCGAWLLAGRAWAEGLFTNALASPAVLQISIVSQARPNERLVARAYLTAGTNQFGFLVPDGFRTDPNNTALDTISLISSEYNCWLTLRIEGPAPSEGKDLDPQFYRDQLLSRYPGAKILEEFSLTAAGRSGPAFDLQKMSGGVLQSMRVAFIPSAAGVLEFSLLASPDNFPKYESSFNSLLLNFRASVNGKVEFPTSPDKS